MQRIILDPEELTDLAHRTRAEADALRSVVSRLRRAAEASLAPPAQRQRDVAAGHDQLVAGLTRELRRLEALADALERRSRGLTSGADDLPSWALRLRPPTGAGLTTQSAAVLSTPRPDSDTSARVGRNPSSPVGHIRVVATTPNSGAAALAPTLRASAAPPRLPAAAAVVPAAHPGFQSHTRFPASNAFAALAAPPHPTS